MRTIPWRSWRPWRAIAHVEACASSAPRCPILRRPWAALLVAVLQWSGCGSVASHHDADLGVGDLAAPSLDGGLTGAAACASEAAAYCAIQARCNPTVPSTRYNGDCAARRATVCINALGAKGTGQSAQSIAACAAAYPTYDCADFSNGVPPAACVPPAGTLAANAACNFSAQCQSGFCAVAPNANCGVCAPPTSQGDPCVDGDCSTGYYCSRVTQTCKLHGAVGDDCDSDDTCGYRLSCVDATPTTSGSCMQMVAGVGASCLQARPSPGASPLPSEANCDITLGLFCVGTPQAARVCVPVTYASPTPSGSPTPCGAMATASPSYALCTGGAQCIYRDDQAQVGTCASAAADGQSCSTVIDASNPTYAACLAPSKCVGSDVDGGINGGTNGGTVGVCDFPGAAACM